MRRDHAISPGFSHHYQDLGMQAKKRSFLVAVLILAWFVVLLLGLITIIRIQTKKAVQKYNQTQAEVCAVFESNFGRFCTCFGEGSLNASHVCRKSASILRFPLITSRLSLK